MLGIVKDLLVCDAKGHGVSQRLTGTEVAGVARMRTARDDHAQAVALTVPVSGGPEFDVHLPRSIG